MIYRRLICRICVLSLPCVATLVLTAADWPQWRGPQRDGRSQEEGLLEEWPPEGPPLVWRVSDLGDGYSTPSIVGDRVYLVSNEGNDNEFVQALDATNGERVWVTRLGNVGNPDQRPSYPAARSTPTIDGNWLYALGSDGDLACLDRHTGELKWRRNIREEFGGKFGEWAYSESPLIDGEKVVMTPGGEEATMLALDKSTGEVIWKSAIPGADTAAYSSIIIVDAAGLRQYVQFLSGGLVGVHADSGDVLWRYDRTAQGSLANIPTPVAQDGIIYSSSGRGGGGAVRLSQQGDEVVAEEIYFERKLPTAIGGAVVVDGYLYGTTRESMVCADFKTGEIQWTKPRGLAPASLCYADDRLYLHSERTNEVALVEANPHEYRQLGHFAPPDPPDHGRSQAWAYPAVANGRLYIHDWGTLWCYDISGS